MKTNIAGNNLNMNDQGDEASSSFYFKQQAKLASLCEGSENLFPHPYIEYIYV